MTIFYTSKDRNITTIFYTFKDKNNIQWRLVSYESSDVVCIEFNYSGLTNDWRERITSETLADALCWIHQYPDMQEQRLTPETLSNSISDENTEELNVVRGDS